MRSYDTLVIGGGIAGVSIGYELATDRSVGLLEMEATLAYHTTGRSVATFLESYGGRTIRLLTTASRSFMQDPPEGFGRPLLKPLPLIWIAPPRDVDAMNAMYDAVVELVPDMRVLTADEVVDAHEGDPSRLGRCGTARTWRQRDRRRRASRWVCGRAARSRRRHPHLRRSRLDGTRRRLLAGD